MGFARCFLVFCDSGSIVGIRVHGRNPSSMGPTGDLGFARHQGAKERRAVEKERIVGRLRTTPSAEHEKSVSTGLHRGGKKVYVGEGFFTKSVDS